MSFNIFLNRYNYHQEFAFLLITNSLRSYLSVLRTKNLMGFLNYNSFFLAVFNSKSKNILSMEMESQFQFWSWFIHVNGGGWIYHTLAAISPTHTLYLARFNASSFFKPTLLLSFSTCIIHVFLGRPCFLFPFTSNSNAFLKTSPEVDPGIFLTSSHSNRQLGSRGYILFIYYVTLILLLKT